MDYGEANLEITASTSKANVADLYYGGIWNQGTGVITLTGSIAANNIGIISADGADCMNSSFTFNSSGYNIIETSDESCGTEIDGDPGVGKLRDNGGPTLTDAFLGGSPAINTIPPEFCFVSTDQ